MNILICDDDQYYLDVLKTHIQEYMESRSINYKIVAVTDPLRILESEMSYDLAFLDVQMEGVDGITLAKRLRERNPVLALFFVTNYEIYQDDAMDCHAFRFFKKPFDVSRLNAGLSKAMEYIDDSYVNVYITNNAVQQRIRVDSIYYVTRCNRKTLLVSQKGNFNTRETLDDWLLKFPQSFFYLVHKSFLVNLHHVERYSYSELVLEDGSTIPIAPSKRVSFRKFWFAYLGGNI